MIEPRTLKGFRDFPPALMIPREALIERATRVYRSYGFAPIDTPALEYLEILSGKGSEETDKQLYKFQDHGRRDVALRFDLTVPLARFTAQHLAELGTPFKRYHIAKVWRGENTQAGRYREFMQCDFDTIGTRSIAADIETALVIHDLMRSIDLKRNMPFERFTIRLNNRKILNGLLEKYGLTEKSVPVLRAIDKLHKIGVQGVEQELAATAGLNTDQIGKVVRMALLTHFEDERQRRKNEEILDDLQELLGGNAVGMEGVETLRTLLAATAAAGVPEGRIVIDTTIARGLDYYTGTIFETFLHALPEIGSVCSGGRYDNLAELYTKRQLPGIGASLGLDRLISAMEQLAMIPGEATPATVFIPWFVESRLHDYLRLAASLRKHGIGTEVYPEPKKLGQQLKYADKKGFRFAVIVGEDEFAAGHVQLKNLQTGSSDSVSADRLTEKIITSSSAHA